MCNYPSNGESSQKFYCKYVTGTGGALSCLSSYELLRTILGLPPELPSLICIGGNGDEAIEFWGWKIFYKTRKGNGYKNKARAFRAENGKIFVEIQARSNSLKKTGYGVWKFDSLEDAIEALNEFDKLGYENT